MYTLERLMHEMARVIRVLTSEERCQVERSFRRLTRDQILLLRDTLKTTGLEQRMPLRDIRLIESVFRKWSGYGLQTKLAAVARLVRSSESGTWPGDTPGDRLINEIIEHVHAVAATD